MYECITRYWGVEVLQFADTSVINTCTIIIRGVAWHTYTRAYGNFLMMEKMKT